MCERERETEIETEKEGEEGVSETHITEETTLVFRKMMDFR